MIWSTPMVFLGEKRRQSSCIRMMVLGLFGLFLGMGLALTPAPTAIAQMLPGFGSDNTETIPAISIPTFSTGNLYMAPVFLDGLRMGIVTSSAATEFSSNNNIQQSQEKERYLAASRAYLIHNKAQKILDTMSRYAQKVLVTEEGITDLATQEQRLRENLILDVVPRQDSYAVTIAFPKESVPEILYTVTRSDIERPRLLTSDPKAVAERAAFAAEVHLLNAWQQRQKPYLQQQARKASWILVGLAGTSLFILLFQRFLNHRRHRFETHLATLQTKAEDEILRNAPDDQSHHYWSQHLKLVKRLSLNALYRSLSFWSQGLLWVLGMGYLFHLFYWTRPFSNWIVGISIRGEPTNDANQAFVYHWSPFLAAPWDWLTSFGQQATLGFPLWMLLILFIVRLTLKTGDAVGDYWAERWIRRTASDRSRLRIPTLVRAFKNWLRAFVILGVGLFVAYHLHQLGTFTRTLGIALGVLSFAISLASQDLLKDLMSGLLILWEDQYAIGDVIIMGDYAGEVEQLSLRITQLRNLDGELITIPNGQINVVKNLSSQWSRVNYAVEVSYDTDVEAVLSVMNQVAQTLFEDPDWQTLILEPPEILGIDNLASTGVLIRLIIKTQPLQQWAVARQFRYQLKLAFDQAGIDIGIPKHRLLFDPDSTALVF